jgi:hypothetical protein
MEPYNDPGPPRPGFCFHTGSPSPLTFVKPPCHMRAKQHGLFLVHGIGASTERAEVSAAISGAADPGSQEGDQVRNPCESFF